MRVAERLEQDVAVTALLHEGAHDRVRPQQEALERVVVVLVAHLELGRALEPADQHVRAGALYADDEDRDRVRGDVVGAPPPRFADGERDAFERVELILLRSAGRHPDHAPSGCGA